MILYYALTVYHQLECVLHKLLFQPEEPAHLYLSSSILQEDGQMERLRESGLFDEVVLMDDAPAWKIGSKVKLKNQEALFPALDEITRLCYGSLLLPIEEYQELYICADHFPFGFALAYQNIPYHYFEEATGAHSRRSILLEEIRGKNEFWYLVFEKLGARGMADCIVDKNIDFDFQLDGFADEKARDFSVRKLLKVLRQDELDLVLRIFGRFDAVHPPDGKPLALLLTQHYAAASITTYEGQRHLYALMLDYFCEDMYCIVKPHPTDRQGIYQTWFPDAGLLNRALPAELLPYCFDRRLALTLSATSSSAYNLGDISDAVITFESDDNRFDKLYPSMHRYFTAAELIKREAQGYAVYGLGADMRQLEHFLSPARTNRQWELIELSCAQLPQDPGSCVVVIDDLSWLEEPCREREIWAMMEGLSDQDFIVFIDSKQDVLFYNTDDNSWAENLVPIPLSKTPIKEDACESQGKEWMFVYSPSKKKQYEFLTVKIEKQLSNTGVLLTVNEQETSVRERLLEGMLFATEKKCIKMSRQMKEMQKG